MKRWIGLGSSFHREFRPSVPRYQGICVATILLVTHALCLHLPRMNRIRSSRYLLLTLLLLCWVAGPGIALLVNVRSADPLIVAVRDALSQADSLTQSVQFASILLAPLVLLIFTPARPVGSKSGFVSGEKRFVAAITDIAVAMTAIGAPSGLALVTLNQAQFGPVELDASLTAKSTPIGRWSQGR